VNPAAELHLAHLERGVEEGQHGLVRRLEHGPTLVAIERLAGQGALREAVPRPGGKCMRLHGGGQ
jgi:hypothetical protein